MACIVKDCWRVVRCKGYCNTHYMKLHRTGTLDSCKQKGIAKMAESLKSELTLLDSTKDPKHRGYLAVNIVNDIKFKALKRNKVWNLTNVEAYKLITAPCHYCGFIPKWPENRVGIDRVHNNTGYEITNCVPCCFTCNSAKGTMTTKEFMEWITRIYFYTRQHS